jgi:hypothetical protein
MGAVYHFNILELIEKYDLKNYIETGTGDGDCLEFALRHSFNNFYSIEIYKEVYDKARKKFDSISKVYNRECNILLGNSYEVLPGVLSAIEGEGNTLFFLDAHFPGADFGYQKYGDEKDADIRIPLKREMETITLNRDVSHDVIIVDDLRVYEDGPFTDGNWPLRKSLGGDGIDFIESLFGETHDVQRDYRHQGFVVLLPRSSE